MLVVVGEAGPGLGGVPGKAGWMASYLEVWKRERSELVVLDGQRFTVGKARANDLAIRWDPTVSRLHAVLERFSAGWCVRDLTSRNGTFVNGRRVLGERRLDDRDEIRVGGTRMVFRAMGPGEDETETQTSEAPPALTAREREVVLALCRPLFSGDMFTEPASTREIAGELVITDAAVKQHLLRLYDKFAIYDGGTRRRVALANEAVRRGAVSLADIRATETRLRSRLSE